MTHLSYGVKFKGLLTLALIYTLTEVSASAAVESNGKGTNPTSATTQLDEVVITPTRSKEPIQNIPFTTSVVSSDDVENNLPRTTPEVLKTTPAVMVQKTGHGQGSPFIRGFTGFRTLFLIDGIRLNNSVFRDGPNQYWNTVDPFSIDRYEITKGPSSVLYGSDAVGGTVNALAANPYAEGSPEGRTYYRYSSAEDSHIVRVEGRTTAGDNAAVQAGVTYKDFGDLRSGAGTQPQTGYDEIAVDAKADYFITQNLQLTLAHQTVEQDDAWRTHKTVYGQSFHGTSVGKEKQRSLDQERHFTYARLQADNLSGFAQAINLTLSHHHQEEERFRIKDNDSSDIQGLDVDTAGASIEVFSSTEDNEWTYGIEFYRDYVDSFSRKYNNDGSLKSIGIQGPVADDSTYDTLGLYLQDSISISEQLDVILGTRYTYISANADKYEDPATGEQASLSESWDNLVGSARILYRLSPDSNINLFAGVSQGFRAPNLSDLTRLDTARSDEIETPSPDLDPEQFIAYEVGIKAGNEKAMLECALFYTDIEDLIVRTPTGRMIDGDNEVTKKNGGNG